MLAALIVIALLLILIDGIWIYFVAGPLFTDMVAEIQKQPVQINRWGVFLSYACLVIGIYYFGYLNTDKQNIWKSAIPAGVFGLLAYGVFDATNLALFNDYSAETALVDTAWGGFVCYITTVLAAYLV